MKKQKEKFNATVLKLQEGITALKLEKYGRRVCVRIEDAPVLSKEAVNKVYEKAGDVW